MEDITFSGVEELYQRLLPALKAKKRELHFYNYRYITERDIWDYLRKNIWPNQSNLTLHEMADDILNTDNLLIDEYTREEINKSIIK